MLTYAGQPVKAFVAAIRNMLFVIHVCVFGLQEAPDFASASITAHQKVEVPLLFLSKTVLKYCCFIMEVNLQQVLAIMQLNPAIESGIQLFEKS